MPLGELLIAPILRMPRSVRYGSGNRSRNRRACRPDRRRLPRGNSPIEGSVERDVEFRPGDRPVESHDPTVVPDANDHEPFPRCGRASSYDVKLAHGGTPVESASPAKAPVSVPKQTA